MDGSPRIDTALPEAAPAGWAEIAALVGAGVAGALQLGKLAPALLPVGEAFGIGLAGAAGLLSVFSVAAGLAGAGAGLVAARAGMRRALLAGLLAMGLAGLLLAAAPGIGLLYAARLAEGVAFLAVVVAAPTLLAARSSGRDRSVALAAWSCFMPAGIALGLLGAPLVEAFGWRLAWALAALPPVLAAAAVWRLVPGWAGQPVRAGGGLLHDLRRLLAARLPLHVALAFGAYAGLYLGIAAFLPSFLVERHGAGLGVAGALAAATAVANVAGNLLAGQAMRRGIAPARLVLGCGAAMALLAGAAFGLGLGIEATVACAVAASLVGGLVPASLFAMVPRAVPDPALTGPAMGLVVQVNNIFQVATPPAVALAAGVAWPLVALPLLGAGALLLACAWPLRRLPGEAPRRG